MKTRVWLPVAVVVALIVMAPPVQAEDPAILPQPPSCVSLFVDNTDPVLLSVLEGATLVSTGAPQVVYRSDGTKISRGRFVYEDKDGNLLEAETVCTSTCGHCGINGCDVTGSGGCSGCSCSGGGCPQCSCTKTSVEMELSR